LGALEAFMVVGQRHALKVAADDLSLSVSALSRRIQALESYVGRPLFDRRNHEFRLTPEGQSLLSDLVPAFESMGLALDTLRGEGRETLRLGVMPAFAQGWLLPRLGRFKQLFPKVEVSLDTTKAPLARLGTALDGAVVLAERGEPSLYTRQLPTQSVLAVCSPALARGSAPIARPSDIAHQTVLLHRDMPEILAAWIDGLGQGELTPGRVEYYDTGSMLLEAAAHGHGVALAFDFMVPEMLQSGRLVRPFEDRVTSPLNYFFACRPAAMESRPLRRFHDWLFDELG
jgi:LysR family transcriptional regulator, glycine cleavage system transcriptional activator